VTTDQSVNDLSDAFRETVRSYSKVVFGGAQYRVEIGAAIARGDGVVNTVELADQLGIVRQSVNQELRILERGGLLVRTDKGPEAGRKVFLTRQDSHYWAFCEEAMTDAGDRLRRRRQF
jgi:DNA-binding MarR family transcriptional regulator